MNAKAAILAGVVGFFLLGPMLLIARAPIYLLSAVGLTSDLVICGGGVVGTLFGLAAVAWVTRATYRGALRTLEE